MSTPRSSLAGTWRVRLDRHDAGEAERWFARPLATEAEIRLPGTLTGQGHGDPPDATTPWTGTIFDRSYFTAPEYAPYRPPAPVKLPFWLTPGRVFVGAAWYQRTVEIPPDWAGCHVTLERPHWGTGVWLDDRPLGRADSLAVPHDYDLGAVSPGPHRLTVRVDNRILVDVGENAHSVSDHTQGNWNGIVGRIELRADAGPRIESLQVYPEAAARRITVRGRVTAPPGTELPAVIDLTVTAPAVGVEARIDAGGNFAAGLELGAEAALWDEFTPALHELTARLPGGAMRRVRFGLRDVRAEGRRLTLNGRPLFLRGTLDCAAFPRTGHPPTEPAEWRRIFGTIRGYGLNHVRFHSWCPPEAAFDVADELGLYLQVEASTWPNAVAVLAGNSPAGIGDGSPVDAWTLAEGERILQAYGNHPSFLFLAAGNEPGGPHHAAYLAHWVARMRALDPRRLYTGAAGWPELAENDYHVLPGPRLHQWGDGLADRLNGRAPETTADYRDFVRQRRVPVVSHEIGQWCAFPPLGDTAKYTGNLKAANYGIFADRLAESGLGDRVDDFVRSSGRLQLLCYKEEIEAQLRTPELGGFQLLGLQDFPGQGTAPVGVLDVFWEPKPYADAAAFRRFCGPTVPLARLTQRVFVAGEQFEAEVEVAHYGAGPLRTAAWWRLETAEDGVVARGQWPETVRPVGLGELGRVQAALPVGLPARRLRLVVGLTGTPAENDWECWVYPAETPAPPPDNVHLTSALDATALAVLRAGGRVVLSGGNGRARGDAHGRVELGFSPIFWNTACTGRQAPHTLGILCDPAHPALAGFPTEEHSNWQWWSLLRRADALLLGTLPPELRPLVGVIDDWYTGRRLGLLFEARVGGGRLLVSGIDLENGLAADPAARQLRASLLAYAGGPGFDPAVAVAPADVQALFRA